MSVSITVILPAYKPLFLAQAIDSILAQTYKDFKLVIVNDNPGSQVKSIVNQYKDPRIRYYENKENIGGKDLIKNWNNCIGYASGEYMVLASDDDVYNPEYLEEMVKLTYKYPTADLYYCRIKYINEHGKILQISQPALEYETSIDFIYQRLFWGRKQALQEFFFRTCALKKYGGFVNFPLAWYSDDATLAFMSLNGVAYSGQTLFSMRLSGTNISTNNLHAQKKLIALKQYIIWLGSFLPNLSPTNENDEFIKGMLLSEYKPILNDLRLRSIRALSLKDSFKEYNELINENAYSRLTIYRQIVKKILRIR